MRLLNLTLAVVCLLALSCQSGPKKTSVEQKAAQDSSLGDPGYILHTKQLTFVGPRSGEGYFSADGSRMIFQSERAGNNPFYQIYILNLSTGDSKMVSTGKGKTTCAWFHPTEKRLMYSSTHLDKNLAAKVKEELETRNAKVKPKYSWSYDDQYDIFSSDWNGQNLKRLTTEKGYDAEGSYSPDGKHILFASNRTGYTEKLNDEEAKLFAQDPSYMMDIYVMDADGKNVKRLTDARGYDGGPFYSADGKKITWRRFSPNGQVAEIWTMNADGSDQKQVTHLGKMSWAPFFHPSGDYIIFTTNLLGYSNFELYVIDAEGKQEPQRVSFMDGFDGLATFSPDGKKLSWTRRNEKGESQIYIADWNDELVRKALSLPAAPPHPEGQSAEITVPELKSWVEYLASEKLQGRKSGSAEEVEYTTRIGKHFQKMGLEPATGKTYTQVFDFVSDVTLGDHNTMTVKTAKSTDTLKVNDDFMPLSFSQSGKADGTGVVFVGYGIVAPSTGKEEPYDSYRDLDVKGKWVLAFRDLPEDISPARRVFLNTFSRPHHKAMIARNKGALGLILVNGPRSQVKNLSKLKFDGSVSGTSIPVVNVTNDVAEKIVSGSGKNLSDWQLANDKGAIATAELKDVQISVDLSLKQQSTKAHNVLALLRVPGATETVVIGAHGDHLGHGEHGDSLASNELAGKIHYGADDNASGVAALLEVAGNIAHDMQTKKIQLKKNIIFAVWSAEEVGILGSSHYLKENKSKISSYVNMDMVGRLRDQLIVQGVGSADEWKPYMEKVAVQAATSIVMVEDPYLPTDAMSFYMKNIPVIAFFTGAHKEYHTPKDTADLINYEGLKTVATVVSHVTEDLAKSTLNPKYKKVESHGGVGSPNRSFRIYLGTIPDYSQEGIKGVKISGTSKDSPAEKAGLKPGDVIIELSQTKIENIYDYVYCLQAMKAGEKTTMKILRAGNVVELSILPTVKE